VKKLPILISFTGHAAMVAFVTTFHQRHVGVSLPEFYHVTLINVQAAVKEHPIETAPAKNEVVVRQSNKGMTNPEKRSEEISNKDTIPSADGSEPNTDPIKVSVDEFPFTYYLNLIRHRIQERWKPPYQDMDGASMISTAVSFHVNRSGDILDIVLERPSGRFLFDTAAQRAVYDVNPLPALPDAYSGDRLTVHIEFEARH
jgi:TonB family protein